VKSTSAQNVRIEGGGAGVTGQVGLHAIAAFADGLGLGAALSARIPWAGERAPVHDRGTVLTHAMVMLAGGGHACAHIEGLRAQPQLFGAVASDSTLYRTLRDLDPATVTALAAATAEVRAGVWDRAGLLDGEARVVLDIDSSLVEIHSENKAGTAPTYKGGFGFHPMLCFADATGETLAALLRPGNAGANNAADHLVVLDAALAQLPAPIATGHRRDDPQSEATRAVMVRADSAGATYEFVEGCRARNIGFAVVARATAQIHSAIFKVLVDDDRWQQATRQDGTDRKGAAVCELTDLVDLTKWPDGTRLIVRREPLHPGAQQTLFASALYRYWGHYTDQAGTPVALDAHMRAHAHVEDHIKRLKASGLERFPFKNLHANQAWLALVALGADLVRWFQLLCLTGPLAVAEPKRLRWELFHTPGRIVRRARRTTIRILADWPAADVLLHAYEHIATLT
jgi:hypothetical protein